MIKAVIFVLDGLIRDSEILPTASLGARGGHLLCRRDEAG
jgi:beta-phosphoglucomutase-like phosphatase (HAD superfamily)